MRVGVPGSGLDRLAREAGGNARPSPVYCDGGAAPAYRFERLEP